MQKKPIICTDLKLTELVSILKRATIYIGNITGPMHIAAALNIPVVAITGLSGSLDDARYWGPRCDNYKIVREFTAEGGFWKRIDCIKDISPDEVFKAASLLVNRNDA